MAVTSGKDDGREKGFRETWGASISFAYALYRAVRVLFLPSLAEPEPDYRC